MTDIHDRTLRPMQVLCLGLPRTGTASMQAALTQLGYRNVHHGLAYLSCTKTWPLLCAAADATFPFLQSSSSSSSSSPAETWSTTRDWDRIFGPCEAVTDIASAFAPQLLKAYPDAKVVLVERKDTKKWYRSVETEVLGPLWREPWGNFLVSYVEPLIGSYVGPAGRKCVLGMLGTGNPEEIGEGMAIEAYKRHYERIRKMLRDEEKEGGKGRGRLLEFDMRDGWGPLCEFLEKDVPQEANFPHVNDAEAMSRKVAEMQREQFRSLVGAVWPWVVGLVGVAVGARAWKILR